MASQGIVSVIKNGRVIVKAVAGCNGYNAAFLTEAIKRNRATTAEEVAALAAEEGFGCPDCLVVMDSTGVTTSKDGDLHPRYRETFADPSFNPRWWHGTAEYVCVVRF